MIARRTLLTGAACIAVTRTANAATPIPAGNRLAFAITRNERKIGTHVLDFEPNGDALTVRIAVDIAVGFGPITLFRYKHRATERWHSGQVVSLESETNDDGTPARAKMVRESAGLVVEATGNPRYIAPPNASPATHWNRRMLDGPLINAENGKLLRPVVASLGFQNDVPGLARPAEHFILRGDPDLDTWYDRIPGWVGLRFKGQDGSDLTYELM